MARDKTTFNMQPVQHIDRGTRPPRPTANTRTPWRRSKPNALDGRHHYTKKVQVNFSTQRPIPIEEITSVKIVESSSGDNHIILLHFFDGTTLQL